MPSNSGFGSPWILNVRPPALHQHTQLREDARGLQAENHKNPGMMLRIRKSTGFGIVLDTQTVVRAFQA